MNPVKAYYFGQQVNPLAIKELVRVRSTSLLIGLTWKRKADSNDSTA